MNLQSDKISKLLIGQSIPAGLGILVLSIYTLVDTLFIARFIGGEGIAAITIVAPITYFVSSLGLGIGMGGASLISLALGKSDLSRAKRIVSNQMLMGLAISIVLLFLGFLFYDAILIAMGANSATLPNSQTYFYYTLLGFPFFIGQMIVNNTIRAEGNAKGAMLVLGIPALLNIIMDAVFIIPLEMGLSGAALATAIAQAIGLCIGAYLLRYKSQLYSNILSWKLEKTLIKGISKLGAVQFFSQASMSIVVVIANHLLVHYGGELALAAYGLVVRIMMFAFFPIMGVVQGFMPIAGYNYGAGQNARVKEVIRLSFMSTTIIGISILGFVYFFANPILALFTTDPALFDLSETVLYWVFLAYPLLGIQQISTAFFQATGKANTALFLTLTKQLILLPAMFLLPLYYDLNGLWYTFPVSEVSTTIIAYYFFKKELKSISIKQQNWKPVAT